MHAVVLYQAVIYSALNFFLLFNLICLVVALFKPSAFRNSLAFLGKPSRPRVCGFLVVVCFVTLYAIGAMTPHLKA
jgi:hypothetical protein